MCNFDNTDPRRGWMQNMPPYFNSEVKIVNYAKSGRSSKSFIDEGYWNTAISHVDSGTYVIIQFGHNDEKDDTTRHTDPWTTYTDNLRRFVVETRQKGGIPILCTSIVRRYFNPDETVEYSHGEYPAAVRKLAADSSVTLVDMEELTKKLVESYGPDSSLQLYAPDDNTHLNDKGATAVAGLFADDLIEQNIPLADFLNSTGIMPGKSKLVPGKFQLNQNYPNPFNPETKIDFSVSESGYVNLEVFNLLGERICTLLNEQKPAGNYSVNFKGYGLNSGIYMYRLSSGHQSITRKMVVMK